MEIKNKRHGQWLKKGSAPESTWVFLVNWEQPEELTATSVLGTLQKSHQNVTEFNIRKEKIQTKEN